MNRDSRRDASLLYRGARLETARGWAGTADLDGPSQLARAFLAPSVRQHRRQLWAVRAGMVVVVVLALVAAATAVIARNQRNDAVFADVVAEADRMQTADPSLAAQLDLVAHRLRPDDSEVDGRILSTQNLVLGTPPVGNFGAIYALDFSPDGHTLATASEQSRVQLWDVSDMAHPVALPALTGHAEAVDDLAFRPRSRLMASGSMDRTPPAVGSG